MESRHIMKSESPKLDTNEENPYRALIFSPTYDSRNLNKGWILFSDCIYHLFIINLQLAVDYTCGITITDIA